MVFILSGDEDPSMCTLISPEVFFSAARIASIIAASSSDVRKSSTCAIFNCLCQNRIQPLEQFRYLLLPQNKPSSQTLECQRQIWLGTDGFLYCRALRLR